MSAGDSFDDFLFKILPKGVAEEVKRQRDARLALVARLDSVHQRIECLPSSDEVQAILRDIANIIGLLEEWKKP